MKGYSFAALVSLSEGALQRSGGTMTGDLDMGGKMIIMGNASIEGLSCLTFSDAATSQSEGIRWPTTDGSTTYDGIHAAGGSLYFNGTNKVYHQGFKPTPADVGAVAKTGDTMTGGLNIANKLQVGTGADGVFGGSGNDLLGHIEVVAPADTNHLQKTGITFHHKSSSTGKISYNQVDAGTSYLEFTSDDPTFDVRVKGNKIYHQGFKPTAADVGALPLTGGTLTGALTLTAGHLTIPDKILHSGHTTANKQVLDVASDVLYVGNPEAAAVTFETIGGNLKASYGGAQHRIYHQGFKPAASDIRTGDLTLNKILHSKTSAGGQTYTFLGIDADASGGANGGSVVIASGEAMDDARNNLPDNQESVYLVTDGEIQFLTNMQNGWGSQKTVIIKNDGHIYAIDGTKKVYHQGFKPTAADVGAVNKAGDTMTGGLTISHFAPQLTFTESDTSKTYLIVSDGNGIRLNEDSPVGSAVWSYNGTSLALLDPLSESAQSSAANALTRKDYVDGQLAGKAPTSHTHTAADVGAAELKDVFDIQSASSKVAGVGYQNTSAAAEIWTLTFSGSNDGPVASIYVDDDSALTALHAQNSIDIEDGNLNSFNEVVTFVVPKGWWWKFTGATPSRTFVTFCQPNSTQGYAVPRPHISKEKYLESKEILVTAEGLPAEYVTTSELPIDYQPNKYTYDFETETWEAVEGWDDVIATSRNIRLREQKMRHATAQAQHFDMMGEAGLVAAWRSHYRELCALEQTPEWPLVEQWPEVPLLY